MKTAAIVIDDWKLSIFRKTLNSEGYEYQEFEGPVEGCITLKVKTESVAELEPIVKRMNTEAARSKMN